MSELNHEFNEHQSEVTDDKTEKMTESYNATLQTLKEHNIINIKAISDGHHTFGDLYSHRMALTIALCKAINVIQQEGIFNYVVTAYRSKAHHPSSEPIFDGMFIVVIDSPEGQMSYHYNLEYWDEFDGVEIREHADMFDGHTPEDVIVRLKKLY